MRRALQILLPIVFLAMGVAVFAGLRALSKGAEKSDDGPHPVQVEVVTATLGDHDATVHATGTVEAATKVDLVPQVAGRVVATARGLTPGLRFRKGDLIARIDPRDYEAQVVQARANLKQAEVNVQLEQGRAKLAARELELLSSDADGPLVRREPQLAAAQAALASAEAALTTAELNLERTRLTAPWDGFVTSESLEVGQYVAPGAPVASLVGNDRFRVRVSVPVERLPLLDIPELGAPSGSVATVRQPLGDGRSITREGYVLRMLGTLDDQTRTAGLLVAIDDPMEVPSGELPILPGAYVEVDLHGVSVEDVVRIPRSTILDGRYVWIATPENTLERREIVVTFADRAHAYVGKGLEDGERVITTTLTLPVEGQALSITEPLAEAR